MMSFLSHLQQISSPGTGTWPMVLLSLSLGFASAGCGHLRRSAVPGAQPTPQPDWSHWESAETLREDDGLRWFEGASLGIEGRGWNDTAAFWNRLPARAEEAVPSMVWTLSQQTAGMAVRFATDSEEIRALWSGGEGMNHMAPSGVSGLDLYRRGPDGEWAFTAVGRPQPEETIVTLHPRGGVENPAPSGMTEYLLFLPLYNAVTRLEIAIRPEARMLVPAPTVERPIVFYGTSITQGGCASRTGMAHPAILRRWLDREVINLGFSGSGKMEPELAELLAELDPAIYVLDCLPNMNEAMVDERLEPFVHILRAARPDTPILLVEDARPMAKNANLRAAHERLLAQGVSGLYYLEGPGVLLAGPEEATVDGVHPTDLGFLRMAEAFHPVLERMLAGGR